MYRIAVSRNRKVGQGGNNMLEFALLGLFLVPMMMGTISTGMGLGKAIQASQVTRDAGHMFVRQVDFSLAANKNIIVRLAQGLNMTVSGGNGAVVLSQVLQIGSSDCAAAGLSTGACSNLNFPVIIQRIVIGNPALFTSPIGNPSSLIIGSDGTISPNNYLTRSDCRANTLSNYGPSPVTGQLSLNASERAFISESYFTAPELAFLNNNQAFNLYARNYF